MGTLVVRGCAGAGLCGQYFESGANGCEADLSRGYCFQLVNDLVVRVGRPSSRAKIIQSWPKSNVPSQESKQVGTFLILDFRLDTVS